MHYDMINDIIDKLHISIDLKSMTKKLSEAKTELTKSQDSHQQSMSSMKEQHKNEINALKAAMNDQQSAHTKDLEDIKANNMFMRAQISHLISNQEEGVRNYIHALEERVINSVS